MTTNSNAVINTDEKAEFQMMFKAAVKNLKSKSSKQFFDRHKS